MGYLIMQILLFLVLTVVLGFVIGWWLKTALLPVTTTAPAGGASLGAAGAQQSELQQLRRDTVQTKQTLAIRNAEIAELREELANAWAQTPDTAVAQLRERLKASRQARDECREEVETLRAQFAAQQVEAQQPHLVSDPTTPPDDLKMISGIGAKLEATLNELGIRHFRQIAEFTPDNVAWVNGRLRFKGRIERERWIEQAKQLTEGNDT
jgi:NADH-quinone oxidoreductase subunit E